MKTILIYLSYARNGVHMGEIVLGIFGLYLIFQVVIGYRRGLMRSDEKYAQSCIVDSYICNRI